MYLVKLNFTELAVSRAVGIDCVEITSVRLGMSRSVICIINQGTTTAKAKEDVKLTYMVQAVIAYKNEKKTRNKALPGAEEKVIQSNFWPDELSVAFRILPDHLSRTQFTWECTSIV